MWNDELALTLANDPQIANNFSSQFNTPLGIDVSNTSFLSDFNPFSQLGIDQKQTSMFDHFLPWKEDSGAAGMGWGMPVFDMGKSILDGWLGMQQLGLAKDNLAFQKNAFSKQFENQRTLINNDLQDRQNARIAASPGMFQDTEAYMKQHSV